MAKRPAAAEPGAAAAQESLAIAGWVALLCVSQLAMFILGKQAMQAARLPTFLCLAQFGLSGCLSGALSLLRGGGRVCAALRPSSLGGDRVWLLLLLGLLWALGFLLLNAAVARMSAAAATTVRALEPAFTVLLGFLAFGERYSPRLVATLVPISLGVVMASRGGGAGASTAEGVALAALSNFGFCARPFLAGRLDKLKRGPRLESSVVFLASMCVSTAVAAAAFALLEARELPRALGELRASGRYEGFVRDVLCSSLSFCVYQFSQMVLMGKLSAVPFSVITPMSKASVILSCAAYFGEGIGASMLSGVAVSTLGVLLFSAVKRTDDSGAKGRDLDELFRACFPAKAARGRARP